MRVKSKNFLKIAFTLCCVLLMSSSCTKENDYYYSDTDIVTRDFTVTTGDWSWDSKRHCFFYIFKDDLVISNVVNNGSVQGTIFIDNSYRTLSYTSYFIQNGVSYAETVNCEYNNGYIRFNVIALDEFQDTPSNYQPPTSKFKVTAISYL